MSENVVKEKAAKNETAVYVVRHGLILFVIAAVAALILGFINSITEDRIAAVKVEELNSAMEAFFPNATSFTETKGEYSSAVSNVYMAKSGDETLGVCVNASSLGFGGAVSVLVGVNSDGTVVSVRILSHTETAGLGANAEKPAFLDQYAEMAGPFTVVKNAARADNEIVALTSATITSNAVTNAVNEALKTAVAVLAGSEVRGE